MKKHEMNDYQRYIAASRYARYLPELKRRETWEETVARYCDFWKGRYGDLFPYQKVYDSIHSMNNMPSMRALMTAGKALDRDEMAGYNCSYVAVDDPRAFDETLYVLMVGTGLGFSVERQVISKLPAVSEDFHDSDTVIKVKDSKIGWASAYRELISMLYSGQIPKWDLSMLRPAGAPLKTFGGRSSGPEPLNDLFKFTVRVFRNAAGRRLTSIECHDIMCAIASSVVVGGVRRSALISGSNLSDERMRHAKTGQWWVENPQRALANNSVVYTEKPEMGIFMEEWMSLYSSKSGERGIFNRQSALAKMKRFGRRDAKKYEDMFGFCNPCCFTGDTKIATADGSNSKTIEELSNFSMGTNRFQVYSARWTGKKWKTEIKNAVAKQTGVKQVVLVTLSNGDTFKCTDDHLLAKKDGSYIMTKDSLGVELEEFFSSKEKYRTINSFTNGYSRQYRMIWEFFNGAKPNEMEIDHIIANNGDNISNLQLLTRSDHLKKTSEERMGLNNPIFRLKDKEVYNNNISAATSMSGNPRFLGCSDEDLIEIGKKCIDSGLQLNFKNCRHLDSRFPLSFSKNRFGGSFRKFINIVMGKESYIPPELPEYIEYEKLDKSYLSDKVWVVSIEPLGEEKIYDLTVENNHNFYIITNSFDEQYNETRGILVHNSEIFLRSNGLCNLTTNVIREEDTLEDLKQKVELATILGTFQSTLTNFRYVRSIWKRNAEDERLLGVSMVGIMDHPVLNGSQGTDKLSQWLDELRAHAIEVNKVWAEKIGIEPSVAITCVKPEGTVSQLVDASSGIHPRYSQYYIRTVRSDKLDPIGKFIKDQGVPCEDDIMKPEKTWVFSFPIKSPDHAKVASDMSAIDQLEHYLVWYRHWAEHTVSITVYVREHEWMDVGAWVYKHFDEVGGISFLPYSDHTYQQAPYQPITHDEYNLAMMDFPKIDWSQFNVEEHEDKTEGAQQYSCSAGVCELI